MLVKYVNAIEYISVADELFEDRERGWQASALNVSIELHRYATVIDKMAVQSAVKKTQDVALRGECY